jgi:hypothetical protein
LMPAPIRPRVELLPRVAGVNSAGPPAGDDLWRPGPMTRNRVLGDQPGRGRPGRYRQGHLTK